MAGEKLPPGRGGPCGTGSEARGAVRLESFDQNSDASEVVELSPEVVAAALLRYCIRNRIPIPKNASKSIQVHGEDIALAIRMRGRNSQPVLRNSDGSAVGKRPADPECGGQEAAGAAGGAAAGAAGGEAAPG